MDDNTKKRIKDAVATFACAEQTSTFDGKEPLKNEAAELACVALDLPLEEASAIILKAAAYAKALELLGTYDAAKEAGLLVNKDAA